MKCENCQKDHDGSYGSGRFCCSKCARGFSSKNKKIESNQKARETLIKRYKSEYDKNPKICKYCDKPLEYDYRKRLTCADCGGKNTTMVEIKKRIRKKTFSLCIICGNKTGHHRSLYCSRSCISKDKFNQFVDRWKNGLESGSIGITGDSVRIYIRRYLFEKYDNKCSRCGWSEINQTTGKIPLEVEHIDGNHKNNIEENLTLLCPNCHSLTSTYRSLNMGKGREGRKRYCN